MVAFQSVVAPLFRHSLSVSNLLETSTCGLKQTGRYVCCDTSGSAPPQQVPLLEMRDITYHVPMDFENQLFSNMNFKVFPGEFIVIMGQNGAGKSTALNLMIGLRKVDKKHGDIYWKGEKMKPRKLMKNIGVVLQNPGIYFFTPTILDELVMGRPNKTPDDVRQVLRAVGLNNISLMANPKSLSGGQTRRLAIASQLMREPLPSLFVLDEPLAGVDWTARKDVVELLGSLKSKFSIVIVSHEPGDLLQYADRVVEVGRGKMTDIDPNIIQKAVKVSAEIKARKREKVMEEAILYKKKQESQNHP